MPEPIRRQALHVVALCVTALLTACSRGPDAPERESPPTAAQAQEAGVYPAKRMAPSATEMAGGLNKAWEPDKEKAGGPQLSEGGNPDELAPPEQTAPAGAEPEQEPPAPVPPVPVEEWPFFKEIASSGGKVTLVDRATGNVWLAVTPKGRAVAVLAKVVLRRGILEHLLCLAGTKEHEAILAAALTPEVLHAALIAAGAEPGSPVRYDPEFKPPTGTRIDIELEWWDGKRWRREPARNWIVEDRSGEPFNTHWVFAGSKTVKHPTTGQEYYLGREGDLITVANMVSAVIDVAGFSSASNEALLYRAREEAIPPLDTPVLVILRPVRKNGDEKRTTPGDGTRGDQP